ncbi:hypothetical protein [Persicirhabdus sediminis]|uniref:Tetratricopeptide repeat-containing protein n=1 Tax=Persicirhabdus sediminis TaxID=454144 RepID=A0A8J7MFH3_9BACT|nr:hypothetical protein [Persicirhabdus sediminis]MBK1792272.1 hypothetical protein [Persicirhabdus sediminis]
MHERIDVISQQITQNPEMPQLYLDRAELNIQHENYLAASLDLKLAERFAPDSAAIPLLRGEISFTCQQLAAAEKFMQLALDRCATLARPHQVLSQLAEQDHDYAKAIDHLQKYMQLAPQHALPNYTRLSQLALQNNDPQLAEQAFQLGIKNKGPVPSLLEAQSRFYFSVQQPENGLAVLDSLAKQTPALAYRWKILEAEMWLENKQLAASLQAYQQALTLWQKLPANQQQRPHMQSIGQEIERQVQELSIQLEESR